MIRFYRMAMTAALLGAFALPALAQTPAPGAPAPAQPDVSAPAAPDAAPAEQTAPATKAAASHTQKHHHVSQKHKTVAAKTAPKPAPATK